MTGLILTTFDWVPEQPRGLVRDLRIRWALEEAKQAYVIRTTPFDSRHADHIAHQPFGQVPWLIDGDVSVFESGAMLLHVAERAGVLLGSGPHGRSRTIEWLFAALNSVEMAVLPWAMSRFAGDDAGSPGRQRIETFLTGRLDRLETVLARREWLAGDFSIADVAMADVLRLVDRFDGLTAHAACAAYVGRAVARPAFIKAHGDQIAHFAAADGLRRREA